MATGGNLGKVYYATALTGAWVEITGILKATQPSKKYADLDYTSLSDSAVRRIPGISDNGPITFTMLHNATNFGLLATLGGVAKFYKVTFSDGTGYTCGGFMADFKANVENNSINSWDISVTVDGDLTVVP